MRIELTGDAIPFLEGLVASGQYRLADEAVAEGVRLRMKRQQLRAEVQKGVDELDAGHGLDGTVVFNELRERAHGWVGPAD